MKEHEKDGMKIKIYDKYVRVYPDENSEYKSFYIWRNPGNCKLITLDSIQGVISNVPEKIGDAILFGLEYIGHYNDVFFVNLTKKKYFDALKEHFKLISCNRVPMGYGTGYHYYAFFESPTMRGSYRRRIEKEGIKFTTQHKIVE